MLDPAVVTEAFVVSASEPSMTRRGVRAVPVSKVDAELLDVVVQLLRLVGAPEAYRVLSPS